MEQMDCQFESEVVKAAKSGLWPDALKQHVAGCIFCQGTVALCESLAGLADETVLPASLPNARLIWMKAQVLKKQKRAAKLELYSRMGLGVCVFMGVSALVEWKTTWLSSQIGLLQGGPSHSWTGLIMSTLPFTVTGILMLIMKWLLSDHRETGLI